MSFNITVLEKSENYIKVFFENVPLQLINAIRRAAMAEVPTMAVDEVIFIDNTSVLYDEIIAHRLGLIPLKSDTAVEKYRRPEECVECTSYGKCEECYAVLALDVAAKDEVITVYSRDLVSHDPDVIPVSPDIPIVMLAPGQRVALEARARLGRGKEHIKWSPVTIATVTHLARVSVDKSRCTLCGKCIDACPRGVFSMGPGELIFDEGKCILCRYCLKVCEYDAIDLDAYDDKYILFIEGTGALKPERIILEALRIINTKLQKLFEEVNKLEGTTREENRTN